jgi:hypothetical protein
VHFIVLVQDKETCLRLFSSRLALKDGNCSTSSTKKEYACGA